MQRHDRDGVEYRASFCSLAATSRPRESSLAFHAGLSSVAVLLFSLILFVHACCLLQKASLFYRASALNSSVRSGHVSVRRSAIAAGGLRSGRTQMWNIFRQWMLGSDACDTSIGSFTRFGERVVARVEVFALLEIAGCVSNVAVMKGQRLDQAAFERYVL